MKRQCHDLFNNREELLKFRENNRELSVCENKKNIYGVIEIPADLKLSAARFGRDSHGNGTM